MDMMAPAPMLAVGTKVVFGSRIGQVTKALPDGGPRRPYPCYEVVPFDTGMFDGHGYRETYPAHMVAPAPLEWSPVIGCPGLRQRWVHDPQANTWSRELVRLSAAERQDA